MSEVFLRRFLFVSLALVGLTSLIYWQRTMYPFVTIKILILTAGFALTALILAGILLLRRERLQLPISSTIFWTLTIWIFGLILSAIFSVNPTLSFWSTPDRGIGVAHYIGFYLLYVAAYYLLRTNEKAKAWVIGILVSTSTIASLMAFVQLFWPEFFYISNGARPGGSFGNPAFLSSFLILGIGFIAFYLYRWHQEKETRRVFLGLGYGALFIHVAAILIANTRGAILGLVIGLLFVLGGVAIQNYRARKPLFRNYAALTLIGITLLASVIYVTRSAPLWRSVIGINRLVNATTADAAIRNRLIVWGMTLDAWKERPVLGWGYEAFKYGFDKHYNPQLLAGGTNETYWDKPHSAFLEHLITGGLIGFISYLGIFIALGYEISRRFSRLQAILLIGALLAYAVQAAVLFDTIGGLTSFIFLAAFVSATGPTVHREVGSSAWLRYVFALILLVITVYGVKEQWRLWRSNRIHYEGLNLLIHREGERGLPLLELSAQIKAPHQTFFQSNFYSAVIQAVQQKFFTYNSYAVSSAEKAIDDAIEREPNNYFLHITRADGLLTVAQDRDEYLRRAENDIAIARELSPGRQQTYYTAAKLKQAQGDIDGALAELAAAVALDERVADSRYRYGVIALQAGDITLGREQLAASRELGFVVNNPAQASYIAGALSDAQYREEALYYYQRAIELYDNAQATLEKIDAVPSEEAVQSWYQTKLDYALALSRLGRHEEARPLYQEVLDEVPGFREDPSFSLLREYLDQAGVR